MQGILDVIIPHLNFEDFEKGLNSLIRNTPEGVIRKIFVIDECGNHPDIRGFDDRIVHIRINNQGFARAMNLGIRLSDAPYVMCLNDDVVFFNKRWWEGIEQAFSEVPNALCVSPSSVCDPDGQGGKVVLEGFEYTEQMDDETYDKLLKPWAIDGICMWGPVFKREMLDKLPGNIPGKAWFDERFFPGGGEDYDMNRRAYLSGMRCLGSNRSWVWHWWYGTKNTSGVATVKHDGGTFDTKWGGGDIYGKGGIQEIPINTLREDL